MNDDKLQTFFELTLLWLVFSIDVMLILILITLHGGVK